MARGLLNGKPQDPGMGAMPANGEAMPEQSNVSPEEQAQYDQFVGNGMQLLYDEKTMPQFLKAIEGDGNPVEGLAHSLSTLVMRLEDSSGKQGAEISGDAKFHGAGQLLEVMVELAEEAGVHEFTEKEMDTALNMAVDLYRSTRQEQGQLPQDAIGQDMQDIMRAEQEGTIDEMLPGISEYAANAPKPEGAQAPPGGRRGMMRGA